jgi:hypothetical protein
LLLATGSGDKRVVNNILVRIRLDGSGGVVVVVEPKPYSMNFMIKPSERWTQRAASTDVSIVMRQSLRTAAREKMLAKELGLYQTVPKFLMLPTSNKIWVPPFV